MGNLIINGGNKLEGVVEISGSKNAVLPILASTIISGRKYILKNVPDIEDVRKMIKILIFMGCSVCFENGVCTIDTTSLNTHEVPAELVKELRASIIFLGPMLCRNKEAEIVHPGGCNIGKRPIDLHLAGLRRLGVDINESEDGVINCKVISPQGSTIKLSYPSVGATENLMLFATKVPGETIIENAAMEPEIVDLANFLKKLGYKISGEGTDRLVIDGVVDLHDNGTIEYTIIPDRIEAATYLALVATTKGNVYLKNARANDMVLIMNIYKRAGCTIREIDNYIYVSNDKRLNSVGLIRTLPYPKFPTDMQAQLMASLTTSIGRSEINETVFEGRFKHVKELIKMGADIEVQGQSAVITGVEKLKGTTVLAKDLRGGAALIIAGLAAEGVTVVEDIHHVRRGYENLIEKLNGIGAKIRLEE